MSPRSKREYVETDYPFEGFSALFSWLLDATPSAK